MLSLCLSLLTDRVVVTLITGLCRLRDVEQKLGVNSCQDNPSNDHAVCHLLASHCFILASKEGKATFESRIICSKGFTGGHVFMCVRLHVLWHHWTTSAATNCSSIQRTTYHSFTSHVWNVERTHVAKSHNVHGPAGKGLWLDTEKREFIFIVTVLCQWNCNSVYNSNQYVVWSKFTVTVLGV